LSEALSLLFLHLANITGFNRLGMCEFAQCRVWPHLLAAQSKLAGKVTLIVERGTSVDQILDMSGSEIPTPSFLTATGTVTPMNANALKDRQILFVKGDLFAVDELLAAFQECGARILGPVDDVVDALELIGKISSLDGAVLDIDAQRETVVPLVDEMIRRRVPFVFSTASQGGNRQLDGAPANGHALDIEQVLTTLATRIAHRAEARENFDGASLSARSKLLRMMPPQSFEVVAPHLTRVELKPREVLVGENQVIPAVWFPETAVISILVAVEGARSIEVGMIGAEGMTDLVMHAGDRSPMRTCVLIPGTALRIEAQHFVDAMGHPSFDRFVLAYKEVLAVQFAYAALSHGTSTIDARLARWILMLDDRMDGGTIPVVHNHIADLLAVRRSGVTTALHVLEGMGAIKSMRGMITVRDRSVLQQLAAATYGAPEVEYGRLMSRVGRAAP
jgi:CRP-like cAMP-binding protein